MRIEQHAPDWLVALHEGDEAAPHAATQTNLAGMLEGWRDWPLSMDFLNPASPNHAWKGLMTRLYEEAIERTLGALPNGKVLDLACGIGRFAAPLAARGRTVHGIDATRPSLCAAAAHLAGTDARLVWGDVGALSALARHLDPPYDAALAIELLCYLPEPATVLRSLRPLLAPGATLVLSVEAWPGALLTDPSGLSAEGDDALSSHTLHEPGARWVHAYERDELTHLLKDTGFEVLAVEGSHYVLDGPLRALADPSRLDGGAYDSTLLALESRFREDPSLAPLPRAWLAIARKADVTETW